MKILWAGISIFIFLSMLTGCTFPGWTTYTNSTYHFQVQYPAGSYNNPSTNTDTAARILLPRLNGTKLDEKAMVINVKDGAPTCEGPHAAEYSPGYLTPVSLSLNGLTWVQESNDEESFGNHIDWTEYWTTRGGVCVSLSFEMIYHNYGNTGYGTPTPDFGTGKESAIFIQIVDTFQWLAGAAPDLNLLLLGATPTDTPLSLVHIIAPTDTPFSSVHILAPTDTPTTTYTPSPSPLIFTPQVSPMEFNYKFQTVGGTCSTYIPQVDISVGVSDPSAVHGVDLFFRLKNKATGAETPWNDGGHMSLQGNGKFNMSVSVNQILNVATISNDGSSAWLEYQFVANNLQGSIIGRSQVYSDISLTPCK